MLTKRMRIQLDFQRIRFSLIFTTDHRKYEIVRISVKATKTKL